MTISSTNTTTELPGTGGVPDDSYAFTFRVDSDAHVSVSVRDSSGSVTDLTQGTDYTVSRNADQELNPGGTITTTATWDATHRIVIRRSLPLTQTTDFGNQGGFFHEVHEAAFDYLTMLVQQLQEELERAIQTGESSGVSGLTLPTGSDGYLKLVSDKLTLVSGVTPNTVSVTSYWEAILGKSDSATSLPLLDFSADGISLVQAADFAAMLTLLQAASLGANTFTGKQTLNDHLQVDKTAYFDAEYDNGTVTANFPLDWNNGNKQKITLNGSSLQPTFTNPGGPTSLTLKVVQGSTGGTIDWSTVSVKWSGGTAPTLSTGAGKIDLIFFYFDGTDYYGSALTDFA